LQWTRIEKLMADGAPPVDTPAGKGPWAGTLISRLAATTKAARDGCCTWISPLWSYRLDEARSDATYGLLRDRFVHPPKGDAASLSSSMPKLPADFEFSAYLRRCCTHEAAHVLHVTPSTWMIVLLFISVTFELPVLEEKELHKSVNSFYVVGLGWALWLFSYAIRAKLHYVQHMLTPAHSVVDGTDEEAATTKLLGTVDAPPYERESVATKHGSKHSNLFWKGSHGPHHLTFLMQILMLFSAICLAVMYTWLNTHPGDTFILLAAFYPVFDVMLNHNKYLLPLIVVTTNVEQLKKGHEISETLGEMQAEKTLRMLKLLNTMATQAKRAAGGQKKKSSGPRKIDPVQEAELTQAFKFFDKNGDNSIDTSELGGVMASFGVQMNESELANLSSAMDSDGSGQIDLTEFLNYMSEPAGSQSVEQIADGVFKLLDENKDGNLTRGELKARLEALKCGLSEADIDQAMKLFDKDKSGSITKKEFLYAIKEMKTFDK
jgi:Ca2+-binding EF-hand superfamily protein